MKICDDGHKAAPLVVRINPPSASVNGGEEIVLLCNKMIKGDFETWFYKEENGLIVWKELGVLKEIHENVAITVVVPPYMTTQIYRKVVVRIQLRRISDGQTSEAMPFIFHPNNSDLQTINGFLHCPKMTAAIRPRAECSGIDR